MPKPVFLRKKLVVAVGLTLLLSSCSHMAYQEGLKAMAEGRKEDGVASLEKAAREKPRDAEVKAALYRHRGEAIESLLREADKLKKSGMFDQAENAYRRVLGLEAGNYRARQGMEQLAADRRNANLLLQAESMFRKNDLLGAERLIRTVRAQDPLNPDARSLQKQIDEKREKENTLSGSPAIKAALSKPMTLELRDAPLKTVTEVLSRSSGLNFVFDKDVKGDAKVTVFVRNTPLEDILRLVLTTNQLERRQLNENSFLIYPNTAAKQKEYQELVVRAFYLANTDVKQAQTLVKTIAKSKDVFIDDKLNLLIVKDTPDAIRLVERLIDSLDLAEPEVMLEVEVLEITRSRLNEIGLDWPDSIGYGQLQSSISTTTSTAAGFTTSTLPGGKLADGFIDLKNRSGLTSFVANPGFTLNIKGQNGDTNVLANPRIRVKNREKAKVHIGEKLPVFTTTSTANVGVSASVNYLDVGLKLEVEPNVTLDDEVAIKVSLEVSSINKEVNGPSNSLAYQVGTRSANTVLRLKDGETQVLAGLINDEERKATSHIPGLGEIPLIGRVFGSQRDTSTKTEIVLLITPRVLRNVHRPEVAQPLIPSGTEAAVGLPPMVIKTPGPKSLNMSSRAAGSGTPATPVAAEALSPAALEPAGSGLRMSGPPEATAGADVEIELAALGQSTPLQVELSFDPALMEARQPTPSAPGRVSVQLEQGPASASFRLLPSTRGEARIEVVSATQEGGEAVAGASASHVVKILAP